MAYSFALLILTTVCSILADEEIPIDIPADFTNKIFDGIEEKFMSILSTDLRQKLENRADKGELTDLENMDDLSPSEKSEIEKALQQVLAPMFGDFVQMIAKSGIPVEGNITSEDVKLEGKRETDKIDNGEGKDEKGDENPSNNIEEDVDDGGTKKEKEEL